MTRQEILTTTLGEMVDMISCLAIYHGAEPKKKRVLKDMDEIMNLR